MKRANALKRQGTAALHDAGARARKPYAYEYPRPALTVDCVVFGFDEGDLKVLLIERGLEPFKGKWALPGGFVRIDETLEEAARRELREEAGLENVFLEQLYTFGAVDRDPRERVVSVAYYALVKLADFRTRAATDAADARWFAVSRVPKLAFDHNEILAMALVRLRNKVRYAPIGFELLPSKFTLSQLQHLYEAVLGEQLDKRNFRKKVLKLNFLTELPEQQRNGAHRPARLYRFDQPTYERLQKSGFNFEV
jgi:8-oxo-dGTP diphosphatase